MKRSEQWERATVVSDRPTRRWPEPHPPEVECSFRIDGMTLGLHSAPMLWCSCGEVRWIIEEK